MIPVDRYHVECWYQPEKSDIASLAIVGAPD
jgi:hypothetical protein